MTERVENLEKQLKNTEELMDFFDIENKDELSDTMSISSVDSNETIKIDENSGIPVKNLKHIKNHFEEVQGIIKDSNDIAKTKLNGLTKQSDQKNHPTKTKEKGMVK